MEALQPVPRLVYGLLRSPVLTQAPGHHPDLHTALRLLWTALPPEELRRAVYPLLSSYTTPDVQARLCCWCAPDVNLVVVHMCPRFVSCTQAC